MLRIAILFDFTGSHDSKMVAENLKYILTCVCCLQQNNSNGYDVGVELFSKTKTIVVIL